MFPFILIFLVEMQASEYGNTSLLARSAIAVTALSGIMVQAKFDNTRIHWRAASMSLLLAAPLAFWGLVIADKLSEVSDDASQHQGLLARNWEYAGEMTAHSTNVEVAVATTTLFFIAVGLTWALLPRRKPAQVVA